MDCVTQFLRCRTLLKSTNHTFLTLILKFNTASEMGDFRTISCVNLIYKLMIKILTIMINKVLPQLIYWQL